MDQVYQDALQLLKDLIKNQCVNYDTQESGNEMKSVKTLIKFFESFGLTDYEVFEPSEGRGNLLLRIKGEDPNAPSVMYQNHLDVVPVTSNWTVDPFACEEKDGWLYGRGTIDMLYYTATQAAALAHLYKEGFQPKGDLVFLAVADEEGGGEHGAKWLVENVPEKIKTDYMIGEFGGAVLETPDGTKKIAVMTSEKSPGWTRLTIKGKPGHASMPYMSENSISILGEILNRVDKSPPKPFITQAYRDFIGNLDLSPVLEKLLTNKYSVSRMISILGSRDPGMAVVLYSLTRMTVVPTIINGGTKTNIIPDEATCDFDIRLLPDQDWNTIESYFGSIIPSKYKQNVELEPILIESTNAESWDDPFIDHLSKATENILPNIPLAPLFLPAVTDARIFRKIGIKCYGYSLLGDLVPTDLLSKLAHGDDERIPLKSIEMTAKFFYELPKIMQ